MQIMLQNVNASVYKEYKKLVKKKTNEYVMGYNVDLFESAMKDEIKRLSSVSDKKNWRRE